MGVFYAEKPDLHHRQHTDSDLSPQLIEGNRDNLPARPKKVKKLNEKPQKTIFPAQNTQTL